MMNSKKCAECKKVKPVSAFLRNPIAKDGLNKKCSNCNVERTRAIRGDWL